MTHNYDYDYFVIGAGSAGVRSARIAAGHGAKVGIAEASKLGGTCVNVGCVPKKLMAYAADYGEHIKDASANGWSVPGDVTFNWQTLIENQQAEIARLNGIYETMLGKAGVDIINGYACFQDEHTIDIDGKTVTADKILMAIGGRASKPSHPGCEHMITSDEFFTYAHAPKKAVIIGGGYIAVEFAHILHGIGAEVTLLYRGDMFLRGFDPDVAKFLANEMLKQGINLHFNTDITECEKTKDGFAIHTNTGEVINCDLPIAAIGRVPVTNKLCLEKAGITLSDRGQIIVNKDYQTATPHIYAAGDVCNRNNLTPVAIKEGHVIADRLFNNQSDRNVNYDNIATAVFANPPIGTIGLSEQEAIDKGYDIEIFTTDFRPMRYALSKRDERAMMKLIVDKKTDRVIGLHMIGLDAPEIVQGFAVAMNCGATKADFDRTMPIHPTSAEEFVTLK